jgi:PKD repeat protein
MLGWVARVATRAKAARRAPPGRRGPAAESSPRTSPRASPRATRSAATFDASASVDTQGRALTYEWNFGDGKTATGVSVQHLFATPGTFAVTLTVRAADGAFATLKKDVVVADPVVTTTAPLAGVVRDTTGGGLSFVKVLDRDGKELAVTDGEGRFTVTAPVGLPVTLVFRRADFATQVARTTIPAGATKGALSVQLMPRAMPVFLADAAAGGVIKGAQGARVEFPPSALVDDETGAPITGTVAVRLTTLNHGGGDSPAFPGAYKGVLADGTIDDIGSFGVVEVTLEQNGRKVQLAPGAEAMVEVPYTVAGGQVGDVIPFWTLDERTGLWTLLHADIALQAATDGSGGLVSRASVPHFSWINADAQWVDIFPGGRTDGRFAFRIEGSDEPTSAPIAYDLDFEPCAARPVNVRGSGLASSATVDVFGVPANCDQIGINAHSLDGNYFVRGATTSSGSAAVPAAISLLAVDQLPVVGSAAASTGTIAGTERRYFAVPVVAGTTPVLRVRAKSGSTLQGVLRLLPAEDREPRAPEGFTAAADTRVHLAATMTSKLVVEISAAAGTGDFELQLEDETLPLLNDAPSTNVSLPGNTSRDFLVRGSRDDLARVLLTTTSFGVNVAVFDARGKPVAGGNDDTGLFRFPAGGFYLVRVGNTTTQPVDVKIRYAPSAPPIALTPGSRTALTTSLAAGQGQVFVLPYVAESGVLATVRAADGGRAPRVAVYPTTEQTIPSNSVGARELRRPDEAEAFAGFRPAVANPLTPPSVVVQVLTPGDAPVEAVETFDLVVPQAALLAGTCTGADTPSAVAAGLALVEGGTLTLCEGDHEGLAGLRLGVPNFVIAGQGVGKTRLLPWPEQTAILSGRYGESAILSLSTATVRDLDIVNTREGIFLGGGAPIKTLTVSRVGILSPTQLVSAGFSESSCIVSTGDFSGAAFHATEVVCERTTKAIDLTNFDEADVTKLTTTGATRGLVTANVGALTVEDSTFDGSVQSLLLNNHKGTLRVAHNTVTQAAGTGGLGGIAVLASLRTLDAAATPERLFVGNEITLAGSQSVGIQFAFNTAPGSVRIDGNTIVGTGGTQAGVRSNASGVGVVGGPVAIVNNVIRDVGGSAIDFGRVEEVTSIAIVNNTLRVVTADGAGKSVVRLATATAPGTGTVSFLNNILVGGGAAGIGVRFADGLSFTRSHNLFQDAGVPYQNLSGTSFLLASNDLAGTASFIDADLRVAPSSLAVDSGTTGPLVPTTALEGARPQGAGVDRGAYEQ